MLHPTYIVAFTGHRSSSAAGRSPAELEACRPLIAQALELLQQQVAEQQGLIQLISSAAEGADTIALEVAQEMGITTHILLPLSEDVFKQDFDDRPQAWHATEKLIASAHSSETPHTIRITNGTHVRPDCYAVTNEQMLASADALIALWNQEPAQGTGGTAEAWNAAKAKNLTRIHINPVTHEINAEQLDFLNATDNPSQQIFNQLQSHLPSPPTGNANPEDTHIHDCQEALDKIANAKSTASRSNLKNSIMLHGCASLLAALGVSYALAGFPHKYIILFLVAITEFYLICKAEKIHHRQHHTGEQWIRFRFAAELLRPYHLIRQYLDPFRPLIQHHHPEWRRFTLSVGLATPMAPIDDLEQAKQSYITHRIDNQITYFKNKRREATPNAQKIHRLMRLSAKSALIVVLLSIPIKALHLKIVSASLPFHPPAPVTHLCHTISPYIDFLLYFLPIALPLLAGILLAYRQSLDLSRRSLRYQHMIDYLEKAKTNINHSHTQHTFQALVAKTEDTLLDELKEFHIAQRIGMEH